MKHNLIHWLRDFLNLFFPAYCLTCPRLLVRSEALLCTICSYELPQTNYHQAFDNLVAQKFYGKLPIARAMALYHFRKSGKVQRLLHHLKYKQKPTVGRVLGHQYGKLLKETPWYKDVDLIIPVPLHSSRLRKRGYNQSDFFAQGLSEALAIPWRNQYLHRIQATIPQTQKRQAARIASLTDAFAVRSPSGIRGQHILLVDDVITTGATLVACGQVLCTAGVRALSISTIAVVP